MVPRSGSWNVESDQHNSSVPSKSKKERKNDRLTERVATLWRCRPARYRGDDGSHSVVQAQASDQCGECGPKRQDAQINQNKRGLALNHLIPGWERRALDKVEGSLLRPPLSFIGAANLQSWAR